MTTINDMLAALPAYDEVLLVINGAPSCRMMARDMPVRKLGVGHQGESRRFTNLDTGMEFFLRADTQVDIAIAEKPVTAAVWT